MTKHSVISAVCKVQWLCGELACMGVSILSEGPQGLSLSILRPACFPEKGARKAEWSLSDMLGVELAKGRTLASMDDQLGQRFGFTFEELLEICAYSWGPHQYKVHTADQVTMDNRELMEFLSSKVRNHFHK